MSMISELGRRIRNMAGYGVTSGPIYISPDDGLPHVQVRLNNLEAAMDMPVVEQHGFGSDLPVGTPVSVAFVAGDRSNGVVTGSTSPTSRPPTSGTDDKVMFAHGFWVIIKSDGVHIVAPQLVLDAGDLHVTGNITATGEITRGFGGSDSVTLGQHKHASNGAAPTPGT